MFNPRETRRRKMPSGAEHLDPQGDPQVSVGVAGSLHGVHGVAVVARHAYKPAFRVLWYGDIPVERGGEGLSRLVQRAARQALKRSSAVAVTVDITATGAWLVQALRQQSRLPPAITIRGVEVGGGQAEPGGAGQWQGKRFTRPNMIGLVQQAMLSGQVQSADDFEDKVSLFRRRHESHSAKDETAWNEDVTDVPGAAFAAALSAWSGWLSVDLAKLEFGSREQKLADHPECRNATGDQFACCCRNCSKCARKWQIPPAGLRRDPGWCDYCETEGLASPEGMARIATAVHHRIDRRPQRSHDPALDGPLWLPGGVEDAAATARRDAIGGGRRIGRRPWEISGGPGGPPGSQLPEIGTPWWEE